MSKNQLFTGIALIAVAALGVYLHFLNISYPPRPAFDEAHFATYVADYVKGTPFFDIHPPFGKLIYAAALSLTATPQNVKNTDFITIGSQKETDRNEITVINSNNLPFNNFPYVPLRSISAIFGVALALVFYWFLRSIGVPNISALLGALFITLENAILIETRLILLNGMYLAFGFAALALYFKKPRWAVAAGAVWGVALGVKMIAIVFAGPLFVYYLLKRKADGAAEGSADLKKFFTAAVFIFLLIFSANYVIFTPIEHLGTLKPLGVTYISAPRLPYLTAPIADLFFSFGNYIAGDPNALQSPWYFWPAMQIPMAYFYETVGNHIKQIVLAGNPAVWYSSTLAAICALVALPRYLKKFFSTKNLTENKSFFILLAGFVSSLLPFATIIRRSTFLYHYFPALIFAIGLLVWFITKIFKLENFDTLSVRQGLALAIIVVICITGFLWTAPLTYGL